MKLLGRTTRPDDLDRCVALVRDGFLYDAAARADLKRLWRSLIERDVGRSAVVFDAGRPERIVAFGVSAAIDDVRLAAILAHRAPFIARTLLDAWRSGDDPFLDEPSLARESARDGINVIVTHNGIDESLGAHASLEALSILSEHFIKQHAGSNMKLLLHESFGVPVEFAADMGLHVTSHAPEYATLLARVPAGLQPAFIISMRRDEAARRPGKLVLAQLFLRFSPPRCALRGAERRLLRLALEGMSDDAIANVLHIAPRTLKKRWADVYAAMEPVTGIAPGGEGGRRAPNCGGTSCASCGASRGTARVRRGGACRRGPGLSLPLTRAV